MPTYDYKCNACDHRFEHFQSMSDKVLKKCPECGKNTLERLIGTGAALIFKGSGFYQTDYRSESYKKAADAEKPAESKRADTKSAEAKSDSPAKPDPAPKTAAPSVEPKPKKSAKPTGSAKRK